MTRVAVILPSRGLMFSRTAEEVVRNVRTISHKFFFSHKRSIPMCFEIPTLQVLEDSTITHLWYVEDDMILPDNTLADMLSEDKDVITCDYPVTRDGKGAVLKIGKEIVYCGTGCLLIKRHVFDKLEHPYWRSDIRWTPLNYGTTIKLAGSMFNGEAYGLHDVTFGVRLHNLGIPIVLYKTIGQRKLVELGKTGTNDGAHKIESWTRVKKDYQLKKIRSLPLATGAKGQLITVDTPTGGVRVSKKHAENLIKQGLATPIKNKGVAIDESEVIW